MVALQGGLIVGDGISMRLSMSKIEAIREGESPRACLCLRLWVSLFVTGHSIVASRRCHASKKAQDCRMKGGETSGVSQSSLRPSKCVIFGLFKRHPDR
jgi:hypothetical protein